MMTSNCILNDKLGKNKYMQQILAEDFQDTSALIEELVQKAAGVSLWIVIVIASLVSGLRNGYFLSYLYLLGACSAKLNHRESVHELQL